VLFQRKPKSLLGLDISTSSAKLIELSKSGDTYKVESYAAEPMPADAIADKGIEDVEAVGDAIRKAVKRSGTRTKQAAVAIGGAAVITKTLQLSASLSEQELENQVELQADQHIPFPAEEVQYDYQVLGPSDADTEMVDVLLAATRRQNVQQRKDALEIAGLTASIVDIEAYALENACQLLKHQLPDGGVGHNIAVVDFGATTTTFSVLHDLKIIYTRDQGFGGRQLTDEIMRHYGLSFEEAGRAKKEGGLPAGYENDVLEPFIEDMAQQVNRSLQFYLTSTTEHANLDQIVICGGCAQIAGVGERIQDRLGIPTLVADPLGDMKLSGRAKSQMVEADATSLMVACGLALRSFD